VLGSSRFTTIYLTETDKCDRWFESRVLTYTYMGENQVTKVLTVNLVQPTGRDMPLLEFTINLKQFLNLKSKQ